MNIRLKIAIVTFLIGVLILLATIISANNIIIGGFVNVEHANIIKNLERVNDALLVKIQSIDDLNRDYATWDATYDAMVNNNSGYDDVDLAGVLSISKLDFAILINNDGKIMYAKEVFSGVEKDYDAATADLDARTVYIYFENNYALISSHDNSTHFSGIIQLPTGLAIISARPILRTDGSGPVHGTIIIGQMMDGAFVTKMSNQTHFSFSLQSYDSISYEKKLVLNRLFKNDNTDGDIKNNILTGAITRYIGASNDSDNPDESVQVVPIDAHTISGDVILHDIFGKPVALLELTEVRNIYAEGQNAVRYIIQVMILAIILFIAVAYLLFNQIILSRLVSMESQMRDIHDKKSASSRIIVSGRDELSSLAEAVNSALDTIEKAVEEKQAVFDADPDTYFYVDPSWKIVDYKLTELSESFMKKKNVDALKNTYLSKLFNSDVMSKLSKARLESIKSKKPFISEIIFSIDGISKVIEARVVATNNNNNNNNNNKMCLILLNDITDRKKFEQRLLEKNRDLEKFNKFAIDRELRMSDMKKEIRDLKEKKGKE